jgi:hypothetical protein
MSTEWVPVRRRMVQIAARSRRLVLGATLIIAPHAIADLRFKSGRGIPLLLAASFALA